MTGGNILHQIVSYCARTGTPETLFGRRSLADSSLVAQMRAGRRPNGLTEGRLLAFMAEHPDGVGDPPLDGADVLATQANNAAKRDRDAIELSTQRLLDACRDLRPTNPEPRRPLTWDEKLALVAAGKVGTYARPNLSTGYDYSLTGGSID